MMPHEACSQHGCWLKSFAQNDEIAPPQFQLLQAVEVVWFSEDDGRWRCDRGEVVGFVFDKPEFVQPGWWYFIRLRQIDGCDWLPPGHIDSIHESELRAIP